MSSSNPAIGALIIVPIVIAASAAYIALKTHTGCQRVAAVVHRFWDDKFPWSEPRKLQRRKEKRSSIASSHVLADSWCDLESIHTPGKFPRGYSTFIGQSPNRRSVSEGEDRDIFFNSPTQIWHPSRSTRLVWSFTNPRSSSRSPFELSSVAKPSPVCD